MVAAADVKTAVAAHSDYIVKNQDTITLKKARRYLEEQMGVPAKALDEHKALIAALIDQVLVASIEEQNSNSAKDGDEEPSPPKKAKTEKGGSGKKERKPAAKKKEKKPARRSDSGSESGDGDASASEADPASDSDDGTRKAKVARKRKSPGAAHKKTGKAAGAKKEPEDRMARRCTRLFQLLRMATIKHSRPHLSRQAGGDPAALARLLEEKLAEHGLGVASTAAEISAVRAKLEQARDLEGIDSGNIIEGGRRRAAEQPRFTYAEVEDDAGHDHEGDCRGDVQDGAGEDSGANAAEVTPRKSPAPAVSPAKMRRAVLAESDDEW
ncbi:unnamed protein product [Pedinophyceae sp. YPF-701]|nr:unnamed protein product [Pedinophyceae sp. YPF-701]